MGKWRPGRLRGSSPHPGLSSEPPASNTKSSSRPGPHIHFRVSCQREELHAFDPVKKDPSRNRLTGMGNRLVAAKGEGNGVWGWQMQSACHAQNDGNEVLL